MFKGNIMVTQLINMAMFKHNIFLNYSTVHHVME